MSTYVLVHGGWDGGWAWRDVARELRAAGHEVYRPSLTGSGERVHLARPEIKLDTHILDVANVLIYEDLNDVILVGSSGGGMVITGVAEQVPERIAHLIYLDAFAPRDGESIGSLVGREVMDGFEQVANSEGDGWRIPPDPDSTKGTASLLGFWKQPITIRNPDAVGLKRTYVLFTAKPEGHWLIPVFGSIAARAREAGWDTLERPFVHYPVLDQAGGSHLVAELLTEITWERVPWSPKRPMKGGGSPQ